MPKPRIQKEKAEPEYIPIDITNVKRTVEVPYKQLSESDIITIEKKGRIKLPKSKIKKSLGKLRSRNIFQETDSFGDDLKGEYTLIITEKPQAALKIASALGDYKKYAKLNVPYYELERNSKKIIIACAAGHLFGLTGKEKGWPVFNIAWEASWKKNAWTKRFYQVLEILAKKAKEFIVATDYDIEGEVIGWNIIRFVGKQKDAKRMKFSTLTKNELEKSYDAMENTINWGQAVAGETRHFLDWMYGINLSRALMQAIKKAGRFKIMSIGRVQGPAIKLIVDKELEIQKFKPEPYFQIFIKLKNHEIELKYEKDIFDKTLLKSFDDLEGKGKATTEKEKKLIPPPFPFDLTSLQREAYRLHGINPARTLQKIGRAHV